MASGDANARVTQVVRRVMVAPSTPIYSTQVVRRSMVSRAPCVTGKCQLWLIQRRDGQEFCFTSHNRDVEYLGRTFRSCLSLNPTASSAFSELGQSGDQSLEGIISDDGISEADLYGGLFQDAYVQVFLHHWDRDDIPTRRLIAGWIGDAQHGPKGVSMQILGPSHRLDQNSVTTTITAQCRWDFGDARCGVDREALAVAGTVAGFTGRDIVLGTYGTGGSLSQNWTNGLLRWVTGANAGEECEIKTADPAGTGVINLWRLAPLGIEIGDTFEILPGCNKVKLSADGCQGYSNIVNFGGFDTVPGQDAMIETPDAKI